MSRALAIVLIAALAAVVVYARLPEGPHYLYVLHKLGHPLVFGLIAWLWHAQRRGAPKYLTTLLYVVLLGAATELAQAVIARDARWTDVLRDALGAAAALAMHAWRLERQVRWRASLALALVLAALAPALWCAAAYANRAWRFPVLLQSGTPLDRYFVTSNGSDFSLDEPAPDWSSHRMLLVDLDNPNGSSLTLMLRIHDRQHNWAHNDRYNQLFLVPPHSRHQLRIPLVDVAAGPGNRLLDLQHVAGLALFAPRGAAPQAFRVLSLRLE